MTNRSPRSSVRTPDVPVAPTGANWTTGGDVVSMFHTLQDELASTLTFVLGNRDDALDAVQEAFLKCWRTRNGLAGVDNLRAWIFRVALNAAKDQQRSAWKRKVKPMAMEELMLTAKDPPAGTALDDREDVERLRAAIRELRPDEQEVFLLRQNGDLTYEQIAEVRKAPVGTVKTQMRAALIKLRQILKAEPEPC